MLSSCAINREPPKGGLSYSVRVTPEEYTPDRERDGGTTSKPRLFISSAYHGLDAVRDGLRSWAEVAGYEAFLFERARKADEWNQLTPAGREQICLGEVDKADLFVGIFHRAYGSSKALHEATVAFTDLEFFEAFRRGIPLKLYILEPFDPEPELQSLLEIIRTVRPNSLVTCRTAAALQERIVADVDRHFGRSRLTSARLDDFGSYFRRLLLSRRIHDDRASGLRFLLDRYPSADNRFDHEFVQHQLALADTLESYADKLNTIWTGFAHLFAVPWQTNQRWLPLWNEALGAWDKASAWYGLHGFPLLGKLAANNTNLAVRALIASRGESDSLDDLIRQNADKTGVRQEWVQLYDMGGSLASEYYSIAKRAPRFLQRKYLEKAVRWCQVGHRAVAMEANLKREAGVSSIHGEILLRLGRRDEALRLLERSLQCRIDGRLGPDSTGWGRVCLGYAYCTSGRKIEGWALVHEGADELERFGSPGFLVRAKKRVALLNLRKGHIRTALQVIDEAKALSDKYQLRDQLADLEILGSVPGRLFRKVISLFSGKV